MQTIETHTVRKGGENYRVIIEVDDDAPNPLNDESGLGILLSLNHRHRNYDPEAVERAVACNQDFVPLSYFEHGLCRCLPDFAAMYYIARQIHPSRFSDIDPVAELKAYHDTYLPVRFEGTWMARLS